MLTKQIVIGSRNVLPDGQIEVRHDTYILEDDMRISGPTYWREVIHPGQDVSGKDASIKRLAEAEHTPALITAYQAAQT